MLPEVLNEICTHFTQYFAQYKTDIDGSIERVYFEYVTETSTSRSAVSATTLIDIESLGVLPEILNEIYILQYQNRHRRFN